MMALLGFLVGLSYLFSAVSAFEMRAHVRSPWVLIAGFGLAHGISEWFYLGSILLGHGGTLAVAGHVFHGLAAILLLEGVRQAQPAGVWRRLGLVAHLVMVVVLGYEIAAVDDLDSFLARWLIVPALAAATVVLWQRRRGQCGWHRFGLLLAALGLAGCAISELVDVLASSGPWIELVSGTMFASGIAIAAHSQPEWPPAYRPVRQRRFFAFLVLLVVCYGIGAAVFVDSQARTQEQLRRGGEITASMLASQVELLLASADLSAALVAHWPETRAALAAGPGEQERAYAVLDRKLDAIRAEQGLSLVYVLDAQGLTRLSTNREDDDSLVGKDFSYRPYFLDALAGRPGRYWAKGAVTGNRGFYAASAVLAADGRIIGVVTVKQDAERLGPVLRTHPHALLVSRDGVVFAASDDWCLDRLLGPPDQAELDRLLGSRQYGTGPFTPLFPSGAIPVGPAEISGIEVVPSLSEPRGDGWRILVLSEASAASAQRVVVLAMLALVCCLVLAGHAAIVALGDRNWLLEAGRKDLSTALAVAESAQATAESAAKAKSTFLATMSHEIRTPLNGVIGMADILLQQRLDEPVREAARVIHQSGETLLALVNDILDFSKIEAGRLELENRVIDLRRTGEDVVALFRSAAEAKGLALVLRLEPGAPVVTAGDPVRFRQVLANLVSNGVKFTRNGSVSVSIGREPPDATSTYGWLLVTVVDTGIGIPAEALPRLFRMFSQVEAGTTRRFGGTGLGLAITGRLVEAMGGSIAVESRPERGSRFRVRLPLPDPSRLPSEPTPDALPALPRKGLRILLAEDDAVNRLVARGLLDHLGVSVEMVEDGEAAVAAVSQGRFDAVLMDVQMPKLDGLAAARAIREDEERRGARRVPIIALTANAFSEDRIACLVAGMDELVAKPVTIEALTAALARNVRR